MENQSVGFGCLGWPSELYLIVFVSPAGGTGTAPQMILTPCGANEALLDWAKAKHVTTPISRVPLVRCVSLQIRLVTNKALQRDRVAVQCGVTAADQVFRPFKPTLV